MPEASRLRALFKKLRRPFVWAVAYLICRMPPLRGVKARLLGWRRRRGYLEDMLHRAVISYWSPFEYFGERDPDRREALKTLVMGGDAGKDWADCYDERPIDLDANVGTLRLAEAAPLLPILDTVLGEAREPLRVVQIGTSSGREIAWFAARHPRHGYVGTDIYQSVVDRCRARHRAPNLRYEVCSAADIARVIDQRHDAQTIVFASGCLSLVQPEHLPGFFNTLARRPNVEIMLVEAAIENGVSPRGLCGSAPAGAVTFTHDYLFYAERAGLLTEKCEIIRPFLPYERFPEHRNGVQYFYWGRSPLSATGGSIEAVSDDSARRIRVLALDIDGVLTDGRVSLDEGDREHKTLSYRDIDAVFLARRRGVRIVLVTGEDTCWVDVVAKRLEIEHIYRCAKDKRTALQTLKRDLAIAREELCYVGDSRRDADAFAEAGLALAPADAADVARAAAHHVLQSRGGFGAVEEAVDLVLRRQCDSGAPSDD